MLTRFLTLIVLVVISQCFAAAEQATPSELAKSVLQLRYPNGRRTIAPAPPTVVKQGANVVVTSERARLVFSTRNAAVIKATLMGRQMPMVSIPDAKIVDAAGRVYQQHNATDGKLVFSTTPKDKYIHLAGSCTPRGKTSAAPVRLKINYDIHKVTGFTLVSVIAEPKPRTKFREFAMEHAVGPDATKLFPWFQMMHNGLLGDVSAPSEDAGLVAADTLPFALWTNGKMGLELTSISYENSVIDAAYNSTRQRHYMTVSTREDGSRAIDMVFVRVPQGREVALKPGTKFTYAMSFLPWRKFRPLYELYTGRFDMDSYQDTADADPRVAAREGITSSFGWEYAGGSLEKERYWMDQANCAGMLQMRYVDHQTFGPHFVSPSEPAYDRLHWKLWYPAEQVREDIIENRWTARDFKHYAPDGIPYTKWPRQADGGGSVSLCINGKRGQDFFYGVVKEWIDLIPTGLIYIDDFGPLICSNTRHGCSAQGKSMAIGDHQFVNRVHDLFQNYSPKVRLMLHMGNAHNNSVSLTDYTNPGESIPAGIPDRPELDIVYSPFLRGTQIIWYTDSFHNKRADDIRTYESALSRCGLVLFNPRRPEGPQRTWFAKYLAPLATYDVENSTVRHPFEPEYPLYAEADTEQITPVIYERPGDALLVVVKNDDECKPKSVTLKAKLLGLKGSEVLVFDTVARRAYTLPISDGRIVFKDVPVNEGPQIIRVMNLPKGQAPAVVWHDQVAWRTIKSSYGFLANTHMSSVEMCGVPESESVAYLYCSMGKPKEADLIAEWDARMNIATCRVKFDKEGRAVLGLTW